MEPIKQAYKGYVLSYLKLPLPTGAFSVEVGSTNTTLLKKIGGRPLIFFDPLSIDVAIAKAKARVDEVIADHRFRVAN